MTDFYVACPLCGHTTCHDVDTAYMQDGSVDTETRECINEACGHVFVVRVTARYIVECGTVAAWETQRIEEPEDETSEDRD
jgi:hypothetical protein